VIPLWQVEVSVVLLFLTGPGHHPAPGAALPGAALLSGEGLSIQRFWQVLRSPEG
jgi:hypothetical protein